MKAHILFGVALLAAPLSACSAVDTSPAVEHDLLPFKARGNEPGWTLDITAKEILLVADYGERRVTAPTPAPVAVEGVTEFRAPEQSLHIAADHRPCTDDATGMPHPHGVVVTLDENTYRGCGGEPLSLLEGPEWILEDIARSGIIDNSRATIAFAKGRVSGRASCNDYSGDFALTAESLTIDRIAATEKACVAEAIMIQEAKFLSVLAGTERFEIDETGALVLVAADGRTLLFRRDLP